MLERWARFAYKRRWFVLAAWVVTLVVLIATSSAIGGDYATEFSIPGSETDRAQELLEESFPSQAGEPVDVVFEAAAGMDDPAIRAEVDEVLRQVSAITGFLSVATPYDVPGAISADGTIGRSEARFDLSDESGNDEKVIAEELIAVADASDSETLRVEVGGSLIQFNEGQEFGSEAVGLIAAVFILLIAFGSVWAMGLPLGAAIFGLGAGFSFIIFGTQFWAVPEFSPQFAAMIGIGVGIDYSLLVVTRFREALHRGATVESSVVEAVTTSGRSVIFAGLVVAIALMGLFTMGLPFVAALGAAGAVVVIVAVCVAIGLTPALLSLVGTRIDRWKVPFLHSTEGVDPKSGWYRMSRRIQRHPLPYFLVSAAFLIALSIPFFAIELGFSDAGNGAEDLHSRQAYDLLAEGFGPGVNGPLYVVVDGPDAGATAEEARAAAEAVPGVASAAPPFVNEEGTTAVLTVYSEHKPQEQETVDVVHHLRNDVASAIEAANPGTTVYVSGMTAAMVDIGDQINERLPFLLFAVIGLSCIVLMAVFRSVLVSVKAAIMNLLSIGAAYGVLVMVFQWGWGADLINVEKGPIEPFLPMMLFTILFGLSMDYEVFLVSRIREEWLKTKDNATSVSNGLAATARVITAAAAIMVTVFLAFVLGEDRTIKQFGLGLATAIFVDATIVRLILVPSTMALLGDANWWLPSWLDRILPRVELEAPSSIREPEAAPTGGGAQ